MLWFSSWPQLWVSRASILGLLGLEDLKELGVGILRLHFGGTDLWFWVDASYLGTWTRVIQFFIVGGVWPQFESSFAAEARKLERDQPSTPRLFKRSNTGRQSRHFRIPSAWRLLHLQQWPISSKQ